MQIFNIPNTTWNPDDFICIIQQNEAGFLQKGDLKYLISQISEANPNSNDAQNCISHAVT